MRPRTRPIPMLDQALRFFSNGNYPQAIELLQQIVAANPQEPEPRLHLAKACLDWVQIQTNRSITELELDALNDEGRRLLEVAYNELQTLAKRHPSFPHLQNLLGLTHFVFGHPEEAIRCLRKALRNEPRDPDVLYNLGFVLMQQKQFSEAATQFSRLTAFYPTHGMGWQNLGQSRLMLGKPEAALDAYARAINLLPNLYQPYGGMTHALRDLGRYSEAMEALEQGLVNQPENWELNGMLVGLALGTNDWITGWRFYACRPSTQQRLPFPEGYVIPSHAGQPMRIHFDQGLGDELFFLRFAQTLLSQGKTLHYTTHPKLYPLLQGRAEFAALREAGPDDAEQYDVLVGDLPYLTGMRSDADIPPPFVLALDDVKVEILRTQLEAIGPPPYLGITWLGGTPKKQGAKGLHHLLFKEISPAMLGKLARSWPGTVVVLQRLPTEDSLAEFGKSLGRPFLDWSRLNDDLSEILAALSLLDEYVGVSNTNMHLLAGIGKVARVLVPHPPEWRWMLEGDESPWFPGFRIYRQALDRSWDEALDKLRMNLAEQYGKRE